MRVVFVSNFMNHHQLPVALRLFEALGDDYCFIARKSIPEDRQQMGYKDMNQSYPFIVRAYESEEMQQYAYKLAYECDVLIAGDCPDTYIRQRLKENRLTFKCTERYFKEKPDWKLKLRYFGRAMRIFAPYQRKPLYFLCASAYTPTDINRYTCFRGKAFRWGYFPEIIPRDLKRLFLEKQKGQMVSILWAGRFLDWKHPEIAILIAQALRDKGYRFTMHLIGDGMMRNSVEVQTAELNLGEHVHLHGFMKPEQVRYHMDCADIFLFTSDRNEGWGVVANEAMNSGCAVVANGAIGAVPYLITDGENGFVYNSTQECIEKVELLIQDTDLREKMGAAAYQTVATVWNADVATTRLLGLIRDIQESGQCRRFGDGPCSLAPILKDGLN